MKLRKFLFILLAATLVFGFAGCGDDDEDTPAPVRPERREQLWGSVTINSSSEPIVGETITATFSGTNARGDASWTWYRSTESGLLENISNKTPIGYSNTYTISPEDADFYLYAEVSYSGNDGTRWDRIPAVVEGIPASATVLFSVEARHNSTMNWKVIEVTLTLNQGRWSYSDIDSLYTAARQLLTITGTPDMTSWNGSARNIPGNNKSIIISFSEPFAEFTPPPTLNLTFSLSDDTTLLNNLRAFTNVSATLSREWGNKSLTAWGPW